MLREFTQVKQEAGGRRRWFEDDAMELIVWYDGAVPSGFQLCYHSLGVERALTWRSGSGFTAARVDAGDERPEKNLTPILVADDVVPWRFVRTEFARRAAELEPGLRGFVQSELERNA